MRSDMYLTESDSFNQKNGKGCFVTPIKWLGVVLCAAAVATVVGLIVYYEHPDKDKKCSVAETTSPPDPDGTTAPEDGVLTDIRLPTNLEPFHYDLRLRPNFYYEAPSDDLFHFNGTVTIHFIVVSSESVTDTIVLHKKNDDLLTVEADTIDIQCTSCSTVEDLSEFDIEQDEEREFYKVILKDGKMLKPGRNYSIHMSFRGELRNDLHGWYFSTYETDTGTSYLVTTQLQPTDARKVFPCFDEPALKATFTTTIERPTVLHSWSNMIIEKEEQLDDEWVADYYQKSVKMSTYLLAFVVADFECRNASDTSSGTWVQVCARPSAIAQADFALEIVTPIQEYFEDFHNYTYPLPRTIHMAVPDFSAGAMENWGLILYRETALLYEPNVSSSAYRQRVAVVVSHELAHMWFGNLVTPTWWDDLWLNEGFASFMEYLGVNSQFGGEDGGEDWKMFDQFLNDDIHRVFPLDSLVSSHPIYQEVSNPDQISELFDTITYSKGASVIRMMNHFLGNDTFELGMIDYFKDQAYSAANHTDLFAALTKKAHELGNTDMDVEKVMNTWIRQLGYPVVTFNYSSDTEMMTVTQKHFLLDPAQVDQLPGSPYGYKWQVPINFVMTPYADDQSWQDPETLWLEDEQKEFSIDSSMMTAGWYLGNVRQRFYYRVNYDDDNWDAIIQMLETNPLHIHAKNRAQILDDLFNLGRAGEVDQIKAFDASSYMKNETDYVPWTALYRNINYLYQMLAFSAGSAPLEYFMRAIVDNPYEEFGWDAWEEDDHLRGRTRALILTLACRFALEDCETEAANQYTMWMENDTSIHPDLRQLTYCAAIGAGSTDEWDFALEQYQVTNSGSEKTTLLRAMACSREVRVLSRYLEMATEQTTIRLQDFSTVLANVANNPSGRTLAWNFFRHNWDKIFEWFGTSQFTLANMITSVTEHFNSDFELAELEAFIKATPNKGSGETSFQQAVDRTKANLAWLGENEKKITSWLKDYQENN